MNIRKIVTSIEILTGGAAIDFLGLPTATVVKEIVTHLKAFLLVNCEVGKCSDCAGRHIKISAMRLRYFISRDSLYSFCQIYSSVVLRP